MRRLVRLYICLLLLPTQLYSQTPVRLRWSLAADHWVPLAVSDSLRIDSGMVAGVVAPLTLGSSVLSVACLQCTGSGRSQVVVRVSAQQISFSGSDRTRPPMQVGGTDSATLWLDESGAWQAAGSGRSIAAGYVVEELTGGLPLVLPERAVLPGDRWPVELSGQRYNQMLGQAVFSLHGLARLDSIVGRLAFISVTTTGGFTGGNTRFTSEATSQIVWDVERGTPLSARTEATIRSDGLDGRGEPVRMRLRSITTLQRQPDERRDSPTHP